MEVGDGVDYEKMMRVSDLHALDLALLKGKYLH